MQKKNQNEVTDFFSKEVNDKKAIERMIEDSRTTSNQAIESKSVLSLLPDKDKIDGTAGDLSRTNQSDAESKGQQIRAEDSKYWDTAHVNYKDPQMLQHKQDTDSIANASEALIAKLFDKLKELGVDCKQQKGTKEIEPEMYIEIEQEQQKEVTYDKHLCEYLRNHYHCRDTLTLACKTKGIQWAEWQDKQIMVPGGELVNSGKAVFWVDHIGKRCFEYKLTVGPIHFWKHVIPPRSQCRLCDARIFSN